MNRLQRWLAPREVRDTLFLLAVITWTLVPHWLRLSPWVALLCGSVLGWRVWLTLRQAPLPSAWARLGVAVLAAGLTWWDQHTLVGRDAGVMLLVMLMTLKTLELRARRDALVVFFLGFFLVLMQFLFSQSLLTALLMGVSVWGWLTALTLAHMPAGRPPLREAGALAARAAAYGTPVMVALFLLFPRIGPLWSMPGDQARTGLSDQLQLGEVAELAQDDSVALRLRFEGPAPAASSLYLRGPVLSYYDGQRWTVDRPAGVPSVFPSSRMRDRSERRGEPLAYEITLEPLRAAWLPLLEHTLDAPQGDAAEPAPIQGLPAQADGAGQWRLPAPMANRVRLKAVAWPQARRDLRLSVMARRELVELPAGHHPRTLAWAAELRQQASLQDADARHLAEAVMNHIRQAGFSYTLSPGAYLGDALDEFWFDRKAGFCEHYAAAFVVAMRAMDVPARIVTGYQGSDPVPADGYWVVRQSHAHAWAEFWQAGEGWVRADPTAAIAPERVFRSRQLQAPPGLVVGALESVSPGARLQLRRFLEQLDNRWNQWVLGYGRQQQFQLLDLLGAGGTGQALDLLRVLVIGLASLGLAGAVWAWWDGRHRTPWQAAQAQLIQALGKADVRVSLQDAPAQMARQLQRRHGAAATEAIGQLIALERLRYSPGTAGLAPRRLQQLLRARTRAVISALNKARLDTKAPR